MAGDKHPYLTLLTIGTVILLAFVALTLRLHRLTELPPGLHHDEGTHGVNALQVLQGEHAPFFPENNGREGMIVYAIALTTSFLGRTVLAVRLPTALISAGAVFVLFWLGWLLFGRDELSGRPAPWRGLLIGGTGAGLLAVSLGQTIIGRTALRGSFLPFFLSLSLALLWWAWSHDEQLSSSNDKPTGQSPADHSGQAARLRDYWRIALAGMCAGLLPYTYITARFTPFLFLLFGLSFLLPFVRNGDGKKSGEVSSPPNLFRFIASPSKTEWQKTGVFVLFAGLVAAPILLHFALNPDHFFLRSSQTWVFDSERNLGNPLGTFLSNLWGYVLAFGFRGDRIWRHNLVGEPVLNLWQALFFWLGVGAAVWHWRTRPAYRLLIFWLALLILPAVLAREITSVPPNTIRMIGAIPAIYLLVAVGLWEAFLFARRRFFQAAKSRSGAVFAVLVGLAILVQGAFTYRDYFHRWASAPEIHRYYGTGWTDLIQIANEQPADGSIAFLVPGYLWQYSFEYLYQGEAPVHLVHTAMPDFAHQIESAVKTSASLSQVKVVDWSNDVIWAGDEDQRLAVLFDKYGRHLGAEQYADFQIKNYAEISLDRPWTLYEFLDPLTVNYDGGIALMGLAAGQGKEQQSSQSPLNLKEGNPFWLALQWQTAPELGVDFAVSLRLHDAQGSNVFQKDYVLWRPDHSSTGAGGQTEPFDSLHLIEFPADLPFGDYELRIVVYDTESLKPTVELGVWEAETTIAHLHFTDSK
ncbi:MAG: hypothetical protein F4X14_12050 [Caldilineaceae bacterium SB0661_bin_32]|uniref:Glycosyltransferase RgtA/B/C/D-like domain-containing protein n=1 Tax=Caldilineaceae bacterium SB0661_bin_32 TaxID=2605255 RepID=A0A6B1D8E8_9CHLR|nr:hypothetical protein [Caldilineaceae bacterium SB0661_bin_32]